MPSIGEVTAKLNADTTGFVGGIGRAVDSLGSLGQMLGTSRGGMLALGAAGAAVAAGGLAAATQQAIKFERTIAGAAARAGATQQAFREFGAAAKQASLDSSFGANEAGGALRFLAKSGFEVQEATKALPGILDGATAAGMEAAQMGEIASNALRAFGRSASETGQVMDVLVKGATSANTSVQELGQGISIVGGLAREAGMGIESVTAIMASMQDAGVGASRAAVALRAGISRLQKPTSEAKAALSQLGVSAQDSAGNFRGMVPILSDLQQAGASTSQMLAIFGRRAGPTLQTALAKGASGLKEMKSQLDNAQGTTEKISEFLKSSFVEQIKVLTGSLATLAANIGSVVVPALKIMIPPIKTLISVMNGVVDIFKAGASVFLGNWATGTQEAKEGADKVTESARDQKDAQQNLKPAIEGTNAALKGQAKGAGGAKDKVDSLTEGVKNLEGEIETLQQRAKDADVGVLGMAAATAQAREKSKELTKEKGKLAEKALPVLQEEADAARKKMMQMRGELESTNQAIADIDPRALDFESITQVPDLGLSGRMRTRLGGLLKDRREASEEWNKAQSNLESRNEAIRQQVANQAEAQRQSAEESEKQADATQAQFRLTEKMVEKSKAIESAKRKSAKVEGIAAEQAEKRRAELAFELKQLKLKQKLRLGNISQAQKEVRLEEAKTRRIQTQLRAEQKISKIRKGRATKAAGGLVAGATGAAGAGRGRAAQQQRQGGAAVAALAGGAGAGGGAGESLEKTGVGLEKAASAASTLTSDIGGLASAIGEASGMSRAAAQTMTSVTQALSSAAGAVASFASGDIIGGISKSIGAVAQGVQAGTSALSGGGSTSRASERRSQKDFADTLAKRIVDEQEKREIMQFNVEIAGRGAGARGGGGDLSRAEELDEARRRLGVGLGGG